MFTKLMEALNNQKANNKGFTLVELIIVVAIIAILSAVLAPQYLQYVERSRESNDVQVANMLQDAAVLAISDPANGVAAGTDVVVEWKANGGLVVAGATTGDLFDAVADVINPTEDQQSSAGQVGFQFTVNSTDGTIDIDATKNLGGLLD